MHKPPEAALRSSLIRFPFMLVDLYTDVKGATKRYTAAVQACRAKCK